ncbi:MAG: hypothetical protein WC130_05810 [Kiritimatiellia bacterium]
MTNVRQSMFSRYMGEQYGNEREGYSKFVTREVLQAVEWALPSLLRVFTGGVRPVDFKPVSAMDVDQARHETDVVARVFYDGKDDMSGFLLLYIVLKDILLYPNAYVKVDVVERRESEVKSFEGVTDAQIDQLEDEFPDADVDVDAEYAPGILGEKTFDVTVRFDKPVSRVEISPIPPDQCIIDHNHHSLDVDNANFSCIRMRKSRSELLDMGYAKSDLEDLSPDDRETWNDEAVTRHFYVDELPDGTDDTYDLEADEVFWVHECYMQMDYEETGKNSLRRIVMAGCQILENEPADYNPIVASSAIHVTHKHIGMGYAEIVADLQELMTTLTRQLLDNIYKQNVSRKYVNEQALLSDNSTLDQLLDGRSEVVMFRGPPQNAIMHEVSTPIVAEIASVIDAFREAPQMRTGVAPQLSLDPSVLEKATMGAFMGALEQASQRLELLARLFAETTLKKIFQKVHYLQRTYFNEPREVEIGGKWVQTDPSRWRKRSNMDVNVGLGFNNKQAMLGLLQTLLMIQKEALSGGLTDDGRIYATLSKLVEQADLGHGASYFIDPASPEFKKPPPPEDPAIILAKAQAASLEAESKRKDVELRAKLTQEKEDNEFRAAELTQKLMNYKQKERDLISQIALRDAQITELNTRATGETHGDMPAQSSSADEFERAEASVGARYGDDGKAKKAKKAKKAGSPDGGGAIDGDDNDANAYTLG